LTLLAEKEQKGNMKNEPDASDLQIVTATGVPAGAAHGEIRLAPCISLARGRVHEIMGNSADVFALIAAGAAIGPVFWIGLSREVESLAPTGMQDFLDPARLVLTIALNRGECLWAAEQALRARSAACVIAELQDGPDLKESRRLQIAAEEGGAVGLIILHGRASTSAAETRWQCEAAPGGRWIWICTKRKRGMPGAWHVSWKGKHHAPDLVPLAATASA
jgi:protein ImuA